MKIGMLFPGYSSQFVGMGKELYDNSRIMQEYFEEASNCLGTNFVKLCFASSDAELSKMSNAYPALFLTGVATAALIKERCPDATITSMAGYGVGEFSALCSAGVLTFPDGLYLLNKLSQFYAAMSEDLDAKTVLVKGLSAKKLETICQESTAASEGCAHIAIYENKTEHIVSGNVDAVDAVVDSAEDAGAAKVKETDAVEGFHTPLLNDLVEQLKIYLTKVDFKDPQIPIVTGIDAKETCRAKKAQAAVMRQISEPIYWSNVLKQFADTDVIIVTAPAKAMVAELKALYPDKQIVGIDTLADIEALEAQFKKPQEEETEQPQEPINDENACTAV